MRYRDIQAIVRSLCIAFVAIAATGLAQAQISQYALADSLTEYANRIAVVGNIKVSNVRIKNQYISIYTNGNIAALSLSEREIARLRGKVSEWVRGDRNGKVSIFTDGHEIGELVTSRHRLRPAKQRYVLQPDPMITNTSLPVTLDNALAGQNITVWGSHGRYYNAEKDAWLWQRARMWTMVEDLYTTSYTAPYLVPMLQNAGAVVIQPREYYLPGKQAVYIRWQTPPQKGKKRTPAYTDVTVRHGGIETIYRVNTRMGGGVWQYLCMVEDTACTVTGEGIDVWFGGGEGTIARGPQTTTSGMPRWMEAARYWLEYAGYPDSLYNINEDINDYKDDYQCRGYWVSYLTGGSVCAPKAPGLGIPLLMSMAFHTDGVSVPEDTAIIGTLAIYSEKNEDKALTYPTGHSRLLGRDLADYIQYQIVHDIRAVYAPQWPCRRLLNAPYCECRYPEVPSMLLEMLSHKNMGDMIYGLNPAYKMLVARAIYKAMARFAAAQQGIEAVIQPLPVSRMRLQPTGEKHTLRLSWQATVDSLEPSANPTYYIVYTRTTRLHGEQLIQGDWDNGRKVTTRYTDIVLEPGVGYEWYVAAGNAGGWSLPSETLSAGISTQSEQQPILVINAFHRVDGPQWFSDSTYGGIVPETYAIPDRYELSYLGQQFDFDRSRDWISDDESGYGMCHSTMQGQVMAGNTFDYPSRHGYSLLRQGRTWWSCSADAINKIDTLYALADVIRGKENTPDTVLNAALHDYVARGGRVLISGAYIASTDSALAADLMHARLRADHATSTGRIRAREAALRAANDYTLYLTPSSRTLHAECVDGLEPVDSARVVARYSDTQMGAGIATDKTLLWAFPMESLHEFDTLYERSIQWLLNPQDDEKEKPTAAGAY